MSDTHSAHLVELNHIAAYRQAIQTTQMFQNPGLRLAILEALDRWEHATPLQFFHCLLCPNGHIDIWLSSESKLEDTVLKSLSHLKGELCEWHLDFINDRGRMIWEDAVDLYEFMVAEITPGTTIH
jgi:hypothetical protein